MKKTHEKTFSSSLHLTIYRFSFLSPSSRIYWKNMPSSTIASYTFQIVTGEIREELTYKCPRSELGNVKCLFFDKCLLSKIKKETEKE